MELPITLGNDYHSLAIENGPFIVYLPIQDGGYFFLMVFHSYISLPDGISCLS